MSTKNSENRSCLHHSLHSQREILGYGMELADALERYSISSALGDEAREDILLNYEKWIQKCPHNEHLCFADITFFSADQVTVRDALTIVITPKCDHDEFVNHNNYRKILKEIYLKDRKHTMAPHEVFSNGLPFIQSSSESSDHPQTTAELNYFYKKNSTSSLIENGVLLGEVFDHQDQDEDVGNKKENCTIPDSAFCCKALTSTYDKSIFTDDFAEIVSQQPILSHWNRWLEVWRDEPDSKKQLSLLGSSPRWIIAAPVGFRNCHRPSEYILVACVFLAFDGQIKVNDKENEVIEALRYILLNLYEANATAWVHRKGEIAGRNSAILPAAHEIYKVIGAIVPSLTQRTAYLIREYFESILLEPDKNLSSDTISLYSMAAEKLKHAADIEMITLLAKSNKLSNSSEEEIDREMLDFSNKLLREIIFQDTTRMQRMLFKHTDISHWFGLALTSAFRNILQHVFVNNIRRNPKARCFLSKHDNWWCLTIENEFEDDIDRSGGKVTNTGTVDTGGTVNAIRGYARAYRVNPRMVELRRVSITKSDNSEFHKEIWRTILPLPELMITSNGDFQ
ncbi:MAG: hypothetical protein ACKN9W_05450 [Methylococcus sp.]